MVRTMRHSLHGAPLSKNFADGWCLIMSGLQRKLCNNFFPFFLGKLTHLSLKIDERNITTFVPPKGTTEDQKERRPRCKLTPTHTYLQLQLGQKKSSSLLSFKNIFLFYQHYLNPEFHKNTNEPFLNKLDFKPFHCKARVQPVSKITTIATRKRCQM